MAVKLTVTCSVCGEATIAKDAFATWDEDQQEWVLYSTYDNTMCLNENCEAEDSAKWHEEVIPDPDPEAHIEIPTDVLKALRFQEKNQ